MYTVIFLRAANEDTAYDGLLKFYNTGTYEGVCDIIEKAATLQLGNENDQLLTSTSHAFGDWTFIVLKDGLVIESPDYCGELEITDLTQYEVPIDEKVVEKIPANAITQLVRNRMKLTRNFIDDVSGDEMSARQGLQKQYQAELEVEKEKETLRKLMAKYPEVGKL